jgi:flagellar biosynthesis protein
VDFSEANRGGAQPHAVALRHERGEVPRVVAQARAWMAEQMLVLAGRHGVPVRRDKDLLALLAGLETGDEIPPELYAAIAQVLVWLYRCNAELAAQTGDGAAPERV